MRTNEQIRISPVLLINQDNEKVGVIPTQEALQLARDANLDLVEVAPNERPPVCRLMDYGRWKYLQKKKHKQKPPHESQLKEVRFRPKIDKHDRETKMGRVRDFLERGDKVQLTMLFRGRERFHPEIGMEIFESIIEELGENIKVERQPRYEGRRMVMTIAPAKKK